MPPPRTSHDTSRPSQSVMRAMAASGVSCGTWPTSPRAGRPGLGGSRDRHLEAHAGQLVADLVHGALVVLVHDPLGLHVVDLLEREALVRVLELVAEQREELLREGFGLRARELGSRQTDLRVELVVVGDQ